MRAVGGAISSRGLAIVLLLAALALLVADHPLRHRERGLVERIRQVNAAVAVTLRRARTEAAAVAFAADAGFVERAPDLVSSDVVAVLGRRGAQEVLSAQASADGLTALRRVDGPVGDGLVSSLGPRRVIIAERRGAVQVLVLLELADPAGWPRGWSWELAGEESTSSDSGRSAPIPGAAPWRVRVVEIDPATERSELLRGLAPPALIILALLSWGWSWRRRQAGDEELIAREDLDAVLKLARTVARMGKPAPIIEALGQRLQSAFPDAGWTLRAYAKLDDETREPALSKQERRLVERLAADHKERSSPELSTSYADVGRTRVETHVEGGRLILLLAAQTHHATVVVGRGKTRWDGARLVLVELFCQTAAAGLHSADLVNAAVTKEKLAALGRVAAGVGHELSNPLTYASMNLHLLLDKVGPELREVAEDALGGVDRASQIAADLSAINRGGRDLVLATHDLRELVESAVTMVCEQRVAACVEVAPGPPILTHCDRGRIEQSISNLVRNAVDAAADRSAPRVSIELTASREQVTLRVRDNGPGVPAEMLDDLFTPFVTSKGAYGSGIGLFLTRSYVASHGGFVGLEETGAEGATFVLRLPVSDVSATPGPADHELALGAPPTRASATVRTRPRVLLIDDEPLIVRSLTRVLRRHAEVVGTTSPEEALELAQGQPFDLALCDFHMPTMNGAEVLHELRALVPELADHFVIITGSPLSELPPLSCQVLAKPIGPEALVDLLDLAPAA